MLWILGDLVGLPFLAAQLIQLMREDESDAARIDAELDAKEAEEAKEASQAKEAALAAPAAEEPEVDKGLEGTKPWWEDDPRFTGRFRPS